MFSVWISQVGVSVVRGVRWVSWGEDAAAEYLVGLGWVLVQRNWRCRYGELDVIAVDGDALVVVEVKTRTGSLYGDVAEAVTVAKYQRMRRLAGVWLREQGRRWPVVRFDVVAVQLDSKDSVSISHLRGVF
ncbi:putative endonuclease [Williamsia muralis]|nr:putative endonuclease [Williamsia marianensis]